MGKIAVNILGCLLILFLVQNLSATDTWAENSNKNIKILNDHELDTKGAADRPPFHARDVDDLSRPKYFSHKQPRGIRLGLGVGLLSGTVTNKIGGTFSSPSSSETFRFPSSKAELPLNLYLVSASHGIDFFDKWGIRFGIQKSISRDPGKIKASDWGVLERKLSWWNDANSLDYYSESENHADYLALDIKVKYRFYDKGNLSFWTALEYTYETLRWDMDSSLLRFPSLNQYYGYDIGYLNEHARLGDYSFTNHLPCMTTGMDLTIRDRFRMGLMIGYFPYIKDNYKIDFLESGVFKEGDGSGDLMKTGLKATWCFTRGFRLRFSAEYAIASTDGKEQQYTQSVKTGEIDQTTDLEYLLTGMEAVFVF